MTNKFLILGLAVCTLGIGACSNTFHGAGADMENAGEAVQDAVPPKQ